MAIQGRDYLEERFDETRREHRVASTNLKAFERMHGRGLDDAQRQRHNELDVLARDAKAAMYAARSALVGLNILTNEPRLGYWVEIINEQGRENGETRPRILPTDEVGWYWIDTEVHLLWGGHNGRSDGYGHGHASIARDGSVYYRAAKRRLTQKRRRPSGSRSRGEGTRVDRRQRRPRDW